MRIALFVLLASSIATAQVASTNANGPAAKPTSPITYSGAPSSGTLSGGASSDPALSNFLSQMQESAQKSDTDVARLRIDKWKVDASTKQQSEAAALSIRRNLANAVPDLVQRIQAAPTSLNSNFKLYRNLNVLYDAFSSLVESAGAFGPKEQYEPLAADIVQLDQLRRQLAERMELLADAGDAELMRLRSQLAASTKPQPPPSKVVVDDDKPQPKAKKKAKPAAVPPATPQQ